MVKRLWLYTGKYHTLNQDFFDKLHGYKKVGWAEEIGERVCSAKMSFNL